MPQTPTARTEEAVRARLDRLVRERPQREISELQEALHEIEYEAAMLSRLLAYLMRLPDHENSVLRSALTESVGLHGRVLLDFLWAGEDWATTGLGKPPRPTDMLAEDYLDAVGVSTASWRDARCMTSSHRAEIRREVGQHMAHLTFHRVRRRPEERDWYAGPAFHSLQQEWIRFCRLVTPVFPPSVEWQAVDPILAALRTDSPTIEQSVLTHSSEP
jgi:hypothetical protein